MKLTSVTVKLTVPFVGGLEASWVPDQQDHEAAPGGGDAIRGLRETIESGRSHEMPQAAANLGILLKQQGDMGGAKVAYQRAIDSNRSDQMPLAAFNLGNLLKHQVDAYSGDIGPPKTPSARLEMLVQQIDLRAHKEEPNPDEGPLAGLNAFHLAERKYENLIRQDLAGATAAYQRAIDSQHPEWAPKAAVNLGNLLQREGDLGGANAAYQLAIDSNSSDEMALAAFNLGNLLAEGGDVAGAKAAYQRAIDSQHLRWAPRAAVKLTNLLT